MTHKRSRLSRRLENQTKKTFFLSIAGILVTLFLLIKFGLPLLANFSLFIGGMNSQDDAGIKKESLVFVSPPILDLLPIATYSAQVTVSGTGSENHKIKLYVNNTFIEDTSLSNKTTFSFKDIQLSKGENSIKAKSITKDEKESEFSNILTIFYKDSPPNLTIQTPSDNQTFTKEDNTTNVSGKTDAKTKIYVNGFWAIVDEDGNFSYSLPLKNGENKITISAIDEAGNKTEKELKISYNP